MKKIYVSPYIVVVEINPQELLEANVGLGESGNKSTSPDMNEGKWDADQSLFDDDDWGSDEGINWD